MMDTALVCCDMRAAGSVPVFRIIMILVFPQDLPRNPGKCTIVRISRPEGTEIMSGQNFSPNKTGTLAAGALQPLRLEC